MIIRMMDGKKVAHDDCLLSDKEIDMSEYEIVENEQPATNISIAGITAKTKDGETLIDLTGRFLG
jgi:hypothetical protein